MVVKVTKPEINVREKLSELDKPSGIAGQAMLAAETVAEQQTLMGVGSRNMIINGTFDIDQRGLASATAFAPGAHFVADRWDYYTNTGAIATYSATHEISDDAPSGFSKSLKVTCTSGGSIPATGEIIYRQNIEGYTTKRLSYGQATAKSATLSFWIKASIVGDYGVQVIYEAADSANRFYVTKYTVNSANTWEYKTITIPPNTVDAFNHTTNDLGIQLYWDLGEGSTYSGTANSGWTTTYYNGLSGGVKIMENTGATWQKTGVQLEVGKVATPFEHRSYGEELALCQRYYFTTWPSGTAIGTNITSTGNYGVLMSGTSIKVVTGGIGLPCEMRAIPSVTVRSPAGTAAKYWQRYNATDFNFNYSGIYAGTSYIALTEYDGSALSDREGYTHIFCDAEL